MNTTTDTALLHEWAKSPEGQSLAAELAERRQKERLALIKTRQKIETEAATKLKQLETQIAEKQPKAERLRKQLGKADDELQKLRSERASTWATATAHADKLERRLRAMAPACIEGFERRVLDDIQRIRREAVETAERYKRDIVKDVTKRIVTYSNHQSRLARLEALRELLDWVRQLHLSELTPVQMQEEFESRWQSLPDDGKLVPCEER